MTTNDAALAELNERYKEKPVSEAIYEIDGQKPTYIRKLIIDLKYGLF